MSNSDFGMSCEACGAFEADVRLVTGGLKTCKCGEKRWRPGPPAATEPAKKWELSDEDRLMLIHFGITREET